MKKRARPGALAEAKDYVERTRADAKAQGQRALLVRRDRFLARESPGLTASRLAGWVRAMPPAPGAAHLVHGAVALVATVAASGCATALHRFPLKDPVWVDEDLRLVSVPCRPDEEDPKEQVCRPDEYVSPFLWDVADKSLFRPVSKFFAADLGFEAKNVNALDEVPDSSWFTNRIGVRPFTDEDITNGSCGSKPITGAPHTPGAWLIDLGKANGANPGFRVNIEGVGKFMLKADNASEGEKATGATAIASRLYHAAGWWTVCDTVVYIDPTWLKLKPGLKYADNSGVERPFDDEALAALLGAAQKRVGSSGWSRRGGCLAGRSARSATRTSGRTIRTT